MSSPRRRNVGLVVLACSLLLGGWSAWRYVQLGSEIQAEWRSLRQQIVVPGDRPGDASSHVSRTVHENEPRFDRLVLLTGARKTALLLLVCSGVGTLVAALLLWQARPRAQL